MTRKNKARHGLARSYRIKPTVKILRAAIVASALAASAATVCAAPLPPFSTGISVNEPIGNAVINNSNGYSVNAGFSAVGISGIASNGDVSIENSGILNVYSDGYYGSSVAYGIISSASDYSYVSNSAGISITAHSGVDGFYSAEGQGIRSFATSGDSTVINDGAMIIDVESTGSGIAFGINSQSSYGYSDVQNSGDIRINIDTDGSIFASGIDVGSGFGSTATNAGDIVIFATSDYNDVSVRGIDAYVRVGGSVEIENHGDITLLANAYASADATAIYARSRSYGNVIFNSGELTVRSRTSSDSAKARAVGIFNSGESNISTENTGDIDLLAVSQYGYAVAVGISSYVSSSDSFVVNSGDISIEVSGNERDYVYSPSLAIGINARGPISTIENYGDIGIIANSSNGNLYAFGISIDGVQSEIQNSGLISIEAFSDNDLVRSSGIDIDATYGALISNSGDIAISAESGTGTASALGVYAYSVHGAIELNNTGRIVASSESGVATAVELQGFYGVAITNSGDIVANDGGFAIISNDKLFSTIGAGYYSPFGTSIENDGTIRGGIRTGLGDDMLRNSASGSIFLNDSIIDLSDGENTFINEGELFANGTANLISIGAGNLFTNNGNSIHMDDGAADDSLTIVGDFNGTGGVLVDVDGASFTADTLFIDGNVLAGTANVISINFVSPVDFSDVANGAEITIVSVTGTSQANNFTLNPGSGGVNGLYKFDYSLNYNQGDYSLAFDLGMSGLGNLASTLSPALQGIWYNSIGTMYQREGSARSFLSQGEVSGGGVWARVYGNDGSYAPDASKNNFGGSSSANFDMSGIALDAGVGYAFNEQVVVGAILGTTDTDVTPESGGEATVSATSIGGYVSYLPGNGFYGDLYYRWMDFDGDGTFGSDRIDYQGKAYGFSLEFGYAFQTASGFKIEPQLQYSDMKVDMDNITYNNTDFVLNDGDSSQLRAGLAMSKDYSASWGKWTPYGALSYVDLSGGSNDYSISGVLEGSVDMSGASALLEIGVTGVIGDWILAGGLNWQDGGAFDSVFSGQLNAKYIW